MNAQRKLPCAARTPQHGFTLIELIVVVSVTAVLSYVIITEYSVIAQSFHRMDARTLLIQDLKRAQAEAITEGCRGIFVIADDGHSYWYGCDFLAYDQNVPPQPDTVSFKRNLPSNISVSTSASVIFSSRGQAVDAYGDMDSLTITMTDSSSGEDNIFVSGTLLGTGVFSYDA